MKHAKWKELLSIILSALFALVLFFILLLLFRLYDCLVELEHFCIKHRDNTGALP